MRRLLNHAANAAVKTKGSIFEMVYRRLLPRLGHAQAIGAIAHRLCRLIWKILHEGIRYEERGPTTNNKWKQARTAKMIRELRSLGYRIELLTSPSNTQRNRQVIFALAADRRMTPFRGSPHRYPTFSASG